ncbi:MAG: 50S ribosomal protein L18 [Candidatus Micrarchaeota archaeon]
MAKATGPTYIVPYRRRRENRTNYQKRLAMIKSGSVRLVVRASNKAILVQFVSFESKGDKTLASASSTELEASGWLPQANTPSAYLTGVLAAKKAAAKGIKKAHLDIGMATASKGRVLFAAALGAKDAGLDINVDKSLVDEGRINGTHIGEYAKKLEAEDKAKYEKLFARYAKKKIDAKDLPAVFEKARKALMSG